MFGLFTQRHDQADEIRLGQQLIQATKLCAQFLFEFGLAAVAAVQNRHVEAQTTAPGYGCADIAHADDTQRLAMHIGAEVRRFDAARPLSGLGIGVQFGHSTGAAHDQREAQVSGAFGQYIRRVGQQNAALAQVVDVVVVVTHRDAGHHLQLGGVLQLFATQLAACADQPVGFRQGFCKLGVDITLLGVGHDHVEVLRQALGHFRRNTAEGEYGFFHWAVTLERLNE